MVRQESLSVAISVIPAKAGTSGQEVAAGLDEVSAFAGMTEAGKGDDRL
jgi:hypothetical protein